MGEQGTNSNDVGPGTPGNAGGAARTTASRSDASAGAGVTPGHEPAQTPMPAPGGEGAGLEPASFEALPVGALLRAQADGELIPEHTARLRSLLTDCACGCGGGRSCACEKFETDLRSACGRVMRGGKGAPTVTAALRGRVLAMAGGAGASNAGAVGGAPVVHDAGHAGVRQSGRASPGQRVPRRHRLTMLGAVSLMLVLVAGVLYQTLINTQSASSQQAGLTAQLASFVSTEHHRTALDSEPGRTKFTCHDTARICPEFSGVLGASPDLPPVEGAQHLELQGAARCGVPGGPSIHVRYYTIQAGDGQRHEVSLFIQRDTGRLEIEDGRVYRLDCPRSDACVWRRDGLIYYAVADDAVGCHAIRAAAGVGDPVGVVRAK